MTERRPRSPRDRRELVRRIRNVAAEMRHAAEQQFNARLRALGQAMTARSSPEPTGARLGKALLFAGWLELPVRPDIERAGAIVSRYLEQANEALRRAFGTATLPENVPPSAIRAGSHASRALTKRGQRR